MYTRMITTLGGARRGARHGRPHLAPPRGVPETSIE